MKSAFIFTVTHTQRRTVFITLTTSILHKAALSLFQTRESLAQIISLYDHLPSLFIVEVQGSEDPEI